MARSRRWALGLLLMLTGAALPLARAQTPTRSDPFPKIQNGRRFGPFLIDPGFTINNIGYDDNVFLVSDEELRRGGRRPRESDYILSLGPDIALQTRLGRRFALTVKDNLTGEIFLKHASLNHADNDIDVQFDALLGPLLFTTSGTANSVRERPNNDSDSRARRRQNAVAQAVRLFLGPSIDLSAKFKRSRLRYTDDDDAAVGERLDRETKETTGELGWRPNRTLRLFARVRRREDDFANNAIPGIGMRDAIDRRTVFGVEFRPSSVVSGTVNVGRATLDPTNRARIPFDGTVGEVSLTYRMTGATRMTLGSTRDVVFSLFDTNVYYRTDQRALEVDCYIGERWGVQAGASRDKLTYPEFTPSIGAQRRDHIKNLYAGFLLRLTGGLELGLRYGRRSRDSNDPFAVDKQSYVSTTGSFLF